jgi:hypothetical protein
MHTACSPVITAYNARAQSLLSDVTAKSSLQSHNTRILLATYFRFGAFISSSMDLQTLGRAPAAFTQSVGLLGRGISPSQGLHLHTGQNRQQCLEWDSNPAFERIMTVDGIDRPVTVTGSLGRYIGTVREFSSARSNTWYVSLNSLC